MRGFSANANYMASKLRWASIRIISFRFVLKLSIYLTTLSYENAIARALRDAIAI